MAIATTISSSENPAARRVLDTSVNHISFLAHSSHQPVNRDSHPDTIGPAEKEVVADFPNGEARYVSKPEGMKATIVNGVPIVIDGDLVADGALPGQVLRPEG